MRRLPTTPPKRPTQQTFTHGFCRFPLFQAGGEECLQHHTNFDDPCRNSASSQETWTAYTPAPADIGRFLRCCHDANRHISMCRFYGNSCVLLSTSSFAVFPVKCGRVHQRASTQRPSKYACARALENGIHVVIQLNLPAQDRDTLQYVRILHLTSLVTQAA